MIRVAFVIDYLRHGSLGTVSYMHNLLHAVCSLPSRRIQPVLFVGRGTDLNAMGAHPALGVVRSPLFDEYDPSFLLRKCWQLASARDTFLEPLLLKHHIDVLSHSGYLGPGARVFTIGWIPDFQHLFLPTFFSRRQLIIRNIRYRRICRFSSCVLLSSEAARRDLSQFDDRCAGRVKVLRFRSCIDINGEPSDTSLLKRRHGLSGTYFYLPNQFWIHKNHRVVVEALKILKAKSRKVLVVCTGNTQDHRQPGYFKALMKDAREYDVLDCFRVLGMVPYSDVVALMRNSLSVINPSFFEGWSTSVEEAKSLGKHLLLSDIPVHREQAPERSAFFRADDVEALAELMWERWKSHDLEVESRFLQQAEQDRPKCIRTFAEDYQDIVEHIANRS